MEEYRGHLGNCGELCSSMGNCGLLCVIVRETGQFLKTVKDYRRSFDCRPSWKNIRGPLENCGKLCGIFGRFCEIWRTVG